VENQPISANAESARMTGRNQRGAAAGCFFTLGAGRARALLLQRSHEGHDVIGLFFSDSGDRLHLPLAR
jgi:hypothetical protein